MRVPESIRNTDEFQKVRVLKHNFVDSKNKLQDKVYVSVKEMLRKKRHLSDNEKEKIISFIQADIDSLEIPTFSENPLVSIIVVNHNGSSHLTRLLDSIDSATSYPNYEIIIVDNDSKDNSLDVIESHEELPIRVISNDKNETFSYANNQAVEIAKGDYLLFLNNDVKPLDGWLNNLMDTMLSNDDVGAVGAKLIYPDCDSSKINREKSYSIQHTGIIFKEGDGYIKPFNRNNSDEYETVSDKLDEEEIIAVTAATLLIKKEVYLEVGGFDNNYIYGYEDVDLCLKLYKAGYKNFYNPKAMLYHYEFGTQEKNNNKSVRDRRLHNQKIFINRWNKWLKQKYFEDKFSSKQIFTDSPLTVSFVVTEVGEQTTAGDYFTALTLAKELEEMGWVVKYQSQRKAKNQRDWYHVDEDVDVLISLLDRYDLTKVECNNGLLIKVAWLRNWFDRWTSYSYFLKYDIVLCSSQLACDYVENRLGIKTILFPLATDPGMFNEKVSAKEEYVCDYCFTGSYWNVPREIVGCLNPDALDYDFNLYGANWDKLPDLNSYHKGFVNYLDMPTIYASTKIVVDDANIATKEFASVNSRIFDSIASGRLVLTNGTKGNDELFGGELPEYHSEEELTNLLQLYLSDDDLRNEKIQKLKDIVLTNHTYHIRAVTLRDLILTYISKPKISIKVPVPSWNEIHSWGDYYVAEGLKFEFENRGHMVKIQTLNEWENNEDAIADYVVVLRGLSDYAPKRQHMNIMWNISHSELVSLNEYEKYDHVFIASKSWAEYINSKCSKPVECMWQCTNTKKFYPEFNEEFVSELLFVGNSRKVYRKIIKDLLPTEHQLSVYGSDWQGLINKKYIKGEHIPNGVLHQAYSSCKILLNDHWADMREKGFVSNRIFDGIACGACIISDNVEGLDELFPDCVFTYDTIEELNLLIEQNLKNPIKADVSRIDGHTYKDRVDQFLKVMK